MFLRPKIQTIGGEPRQALELFKRLAPVPTVPRVADKFTLHFEPSELSANLDRKKRLRPLAH